MIGQKITARAHTNIALVKYWGKKDTTMIIPYTDSLSLTLDEFYTTTSVEFNEHLTEDQFTIDGSIVSGPGYQKLVKFMDVVREVAGISDYANVKSENHVPMSAGLASSASAFAALSAAAIQAAGVHLSSKDLSRLARRGSGSATRSIFGGLAKWNAGHDDLSSFAEPIQEHVDFGLEMMAIMIDRGPKKISSRSGMQSVVETSPYYSAWINVVKNDMARMQDAIIKKDINLIGQISQTNAMRMHALNLSAEPNFSYFTAETIEAMNLIDNLHSMGMNCYYTLDAGPNVKVICDHKDQDVIYNKLSNQFGRENVVIAHPGPGISYLK